MPDLDLSSLSAAAGPMQTWVLPALLGLGLASATGTNARRYATGSTRVETTAPTGAAEATRRTMRSEGLTVCAPNGSNPVTRSRGFILPAS